MIIIARQMSGNALCHSGNRRRYPPPPSLAGKNSWHAGGKGAGDILIPNFSTLGYDLTTPVQNKTRREKMIARTKKLWKK